MIGFNPLFDPYHAWLMLCRMQASNFPSLSISRHVIQAIWQTTLSSSDDKVSGLLGSQCNGEIDEIVHKSLWKALQAGTACAAINQTLLGELHTLSQAWKDHQTTLSGVYQCEQPDIVSMQATEKLLASCFQQTEGMPFIHLYIHFDTEGVLESEAWTLKAGQTMQIPMQLTEDRQPARRS